MQLVKNYGAAGFLAAGATRSLGPLDAGKTIKLDTLAGSVVTLPASVGRGAKYNFLVSVLATSNSHIVKVANATDVMRGVIGGFNNATGAMTGFAAGAADDTITLNRAGTGSVSLGEWLELIDFAVGFWAVAGVLSASGAAFTTPFSSTV
jgi:hypothetical protein